MAVKSALYSTKVPVVTVSAVDGGEPELELSSDPFNHSRYYNIYIYFISHAQLHFPITHTSTIDFKPLTSGLKGDYARTRDKE